MNTVDKQSQNIDNSEAGQALWALEKKSLDQVDYKSYTFKLAETCSKFDQEQIRSCNETMYEALLVKNKNFNHKIA